MPTTYQITANGSAAVYVRISGSNLVAMTEEGNIETHAAAGDRWASLMGAEWDECDEGESFRVLGIYGAFIGEDEHPDPADYTVAKFAEAADPQAAIDHLDATADGDCWVYYADETSHYYRVTREELVELAELLKHIDADIRRDAYSHWCAGGAGVDIGTAFPAAK